MPVRSKSQLKYIFAMRKKYKSKKNAPKDKKWVFITMKLTEGPQFTVNKISFQGEVLFPETGLREKMVLKSKKLILKSL